MEILIVILASIISIAFWIGVYNGILFLMKLYKNKKAKKFENEIKKQIDTIKIGDVFIDKDYVSYFNDPFLDIDKFSKKKSTSILIIDDIKENDCGEMWVKYHYLSHEYNENEFDICTRTAKSLLEHFSRDAHDKLKNCFIIHKPNIPLNKY